MNFCSSSANWAMQAILPLYNNAKLVFYNNPQPTTPETVLAGTNTALCTFTFNTAAFGALSFSSPNELATASFVASSVTPGANGTATFARATLAANAWAANAVYNTLFAVVTNSSNFYILTHIGTAAASGGPGGTTNSITDNTAQWAYYASSAGQNNVLADFSIGTAGTDIVIGNTNITVSVNVTITSFVLQMTAS